MQLFYQAWSFVSFIFMRYKEYNRNAVLEKAILLFWQRGFNGCSIKELVEATGVNRFSLYHEFNNKEGILYASLELYKERYAGDKLDLLRNSDGAPHDVLMRFYMSFLEDDLPVAGCYFVHVGTEMADSDEQIRESLDQYLQEIQALISGLLARKGVDEDVEHYARHLTGLYCTAMSFCLVHSPEERQNYISNGIHIILSNYAESIEQ